MRRPVFPGDSTLPMFQTRPKLRPAAAMLLASLLLAGAPAEARQPSFRVLSAREVGADASMAEVELTISNDGPDGELYVMALAKSRDGQVRGGPVLTPNPLPAGREARVSVFVPRPQDGGAQHTDVLLVSAQTGDWKVVARGRVDWAHDWPALPAPGAQGGGDGLLPRRDDAGIVSANLGDEDFAALDLLLQEWNSPQARDESGAWKLDAFNAAINALADTAHWEEGLARIRRWKQFNRESPGAAVAEARMWMAYAWAAVGRCGCGAQERPVGVARRLFDARMKRAERALLASKTYAAANPLWHQARLDVAIDSGRGERFVRELFEQAIAQYPLYSPLYLSMAKYWAPGEGRAARWDELEELARSAVELTRATDGEDNYAWLYAEVGARQPLEVDILRVSAVSWPRMRDAFRDLVRRHPSVDNYNRFALYACRAGDKETYLTLAPKLRDHAAPDLWPGNYSIDLCDHRFMQQS